ncbi:hypothetical protein [Streptomyces poonensis]|uniref:Uncharacterized protein n=1 Tax=Streptomyces poonensis TaxID=68255 RepID=A0A918PDW5_9ACTN|nr:hypothetical protein [Streptomyces poonensis]GGY99779.1 hypothetical protein GCM10010365_18140 [Streptomyces poonensis]GLJ92197.1 hypothetical protein GCM10017589_48060 [Streptomyces poonensis]
MIIIVAVLLLPAVWGLLLGMAWWEEHLFDEADRPRHARARRHLRLIRGGRDTRDAVAPVTGRERDAA